MNMDEKYSDKVAYDLAMLYAKSRFEHDLANDLVPKDFAEPNSSVLKNEAYYLAYLFRNSYNEYTSKKIIDDFLDFIFEPWNPPNHLE